MFTNLHTLPPGQSMFTLFISPSRELSGLGPEEMDLVAPHIVPTYRHLTAMVIEQAREALVRNYGPETVVLGVVNQSRGETIFDYRAKGHTPLPLVLPARTLETFERPYDALLDLAQDEADLGNGSGEYRDWLLEVKK